MDEIRVLLATHREPVHQKSALATAPEGAHVTICAAARYETVVERIGDADVLVSERSGRIDAPLIRRGRNLRLIQRWGRMTHDIDLGAAREAGVAVCYQPLHNAMMVAEHVVMQILGLAKCVRECEDVLLDPRDWGMEPRQCDANQFAINWSGRRDIMPVLGSTVGIVGFGEIGAELAERLKRSTAIGARPGADMASSFRAGWQNVVNLMQGRLLVNRLC